MSSHSNIVPQKYHLTCDISLLVRISDAEQGGPLLSAAHLSLMPSQSRLCVQLVVRACCRVSVPAVFGYKCKAT